MHAAWALLLLLPLAIGLVWGIRRLRRWVPLVALLGAGTSLAVWELLAWVDWQTTSAPSTEDAFATVEYIMRDVDYGWLRRYLLEVWGWVPGLALFVACWALALFGPGGRAPRAAND